MLSEQLNNVSYKIRMAVCDCIPVVSGIISRDIAQKLVSIMWYITCLPWLRPYLIES